MVALERKPEFPAWELLIERTNNVRSTKAKHRRRVVGLFALVTIILCIAGFSGGSKAQNPSNAEEVVFSTPGFFPMILTGNTKPATALGFWIWCAAEPSPASGQPTYQFFNACQGSMYFYALDKHPSPIVGFVTETPADSGLYTMTVFQGTFAQLKSGTLNPAFICTLNNPDLPHQGPTNEVDVNCVFTSALGGGTGTAAVTNSTVNVTGP